MGEKVTFFTSHKTTLLIEKFYNFMNYNGLEGTLLKGSSPRLMDIQLGDLNEVGEL